MKIIVTSILAATLSMASVCAQTAEEIVSKNINAIGGKEMMDKIKSVKMVGKVVAQGMEFPFENCIKDGKKMRNEAVFQGMKMIQVFDGNEGWMVNPMMGAKEPEKMNEEMVKELKSQSDFKGALYDYKSKESKLEFIGKEDMEGDEVFKVQLTEKSGDITYYFFDAKTYMILKSTSKRKFQDKEYEADTFFSNYQKIDGYTSAFTMDTKMSGQVVSQVKIDKLEINPNLDDSLFKKPSSN